MTAQELVEMIARMSTPYDGIEDEGMRRHAFALGRGGYAGLQIAFEG